MWSARARVEQPGVLEVPLGVTRAILVVLAMACVARAQVADCPTCQPERLLRALPSGYDAVLMVNNAARQRQSAAGRSLASMLKESGALPETAVAWEAFAKAMDWTQEQAFDLLLGRRFTLVVRGLDGPGAPDWAALTEVPAEAEQRLRDRLKAAPRGSLAGLAVLAVEDGKYELMVGRGPGAEPAHPETEPTATVLLGPGGENPLFTELAPQLRTRTGLASPPSAWHAGQKDRECDVVLMLRREGGARTLTLTATMERQGWDAHVVSSPGLVWDRPRGGGPVHAWSDAAFVSLEREALVGVMGVTGTVGLPGAAWALVGAEAGFWPAPEGRLGALFVHPVRARTSVHAPAAPSAAKVVLLDRDRAHVAGETSSPEPVALLGRWCAVLAVEGAKGETGRARGLATRVAEALQTGAAPEAGEGPQEQAEPGFSSVALSDLVQVHESVLMRLTRLVGDDPALSWGTAAVRGSAVAAAKGPRTPEPHGTWDVVSIAPSGTEMAAADAGVLASSVGGNSRAWLSIGLIRPAALASVLGKDDAMVPAWARRVERLRWEAWLRDDGLVESSVSVRMAP